MPTSIRIEKETEILDGVKVELKGNEILVTGGEEALSMDFQHPRIEVSVEKQRVLVTCDYPSKEEEALMGTIKSHIRNMITGVTEGFEYKMKIVYSHFPIKASVQEDKREFMIENFLGERSPRIAKIVGRTNITINGDEVILTGPDIQHVGQSAANIEQVTMIKGFDPRVFQDGIYITQKRREA
jgi:large subunit ribosomal protein L6